MLSDNQIESVWKDMIRAEVRSMYFATLTQKYTRRKQWLNAIVLFLTSGAAVSVGAKFPDALTLAFSVVAAIIAAYTIAFGLDKLTSTLTKLHFLWNELYAAHERLWNHWYEEDAERCLDELLRRARDASELGTEVPYDESLMDKWEKRVYAQYAATATA